MLRATYICSPCPIGQRSSDSPWITSVAVVAWCANVDGEWAAYQSRRACGGPPYWTSHQLWPMSLVPYIDSRSKTGARLTAALKRLVCPIVQATM